MLENQKHTKDIETYVNEHSIQLSLGPMMANDGNKKNSLKGCQLYIIHFIKIVKMAIQIQIIELFCFTICCLIQIHNK